MIMRQVTDIRALESEGPRSQTTLAYELIRSDILTGRHLPEKKLKIQELAAELDVSPGAVREALSRLVPEQLVVSRDQRGFVVAPLSIADLIDLTDLRCEIEAVALRRSVERADRDWEANILAAEHRLGGQFVVIGTDEFKLNPAWVKMHAAFHTALVSACGSRRLLALHAQLYEQSERYRGLSLHVETPRNVTDEHSDIVKMALARDAESLIRTTVEHLRKTTDLIVAAAARAPVSAVV
jgi:DNA-binding GntR family transcriptional regulator